MNMEHMAFKVQSTKYKVQYNIPTGMIWVGVLLGEYYGA